MIPILTASKLTQSTHPLLAMHRLHQSLLISSFPPDPTKDLLDETIRVAATSVAGLNAVLEAGHPVRAVALAELGKLLAVDEPAAPGQTTSPTPRFNTFPPVGEARLALAKDTLQRALSELLVAFGRESGGGETGREIRAMLVDVERELGVWKAGLRDALVDATAERRGRSLEASVPQ